jgi:DNA replication licensing factor MCM2
MCQENLQSLEITFNHLSIKQPTLAIWLAEEPGLMLPILNQVAMELCLEVYPDYSKTFDNIFVRVKDLPVEDKLRDLRQVHLNSLIKIRGVVTKRTGVFPELKEKWMQCRNCGDVKGPIITEEQERFLGRCISCNTGAYIEMSERCVYRNYQKWTI